MARSFTLETKAFPDIALKLPVVQISQDLSRTHVCSQNKSDTEQAEGLWKSKPLSISMEEGFLLEAKALCFSSATGETGGGTIEMIKGLTTEIQHGEGAQPVLHVSFMLLCSYY